MNNCELGAKNNSHEHEIMQHTKQIREQHTHTLTHSNLIEKFTINKLLQSF